MQDVQSFRALFDGNDHPVWRLVVTSADEDAVACSPSFVLYRGIHNLFATNTFQLKDARLCKADGDDDLIKRYGVRWMRLRVSGELSRTRYALRSVSSRSYLSRSLRRLRREHWEHLFLGISQQMESWQVRLDATRLDQIVELVQTDVRAAYFLLAAAFQRALGRRLDRLHCQLRVLSSRFRSLLSHPLCNSYSERNLISSQRPWFLHHGAHPSDLYTLSAKAVS